MPGGAIFRVGYFGGKWASGIQTLVKHRRLERNFSGENGGNYPSVGAERVEVIWWQWARDLWLCHLDFGELLVGVHRSSLSASQIPIPKRKVAVPCPLVWFMFSEWPRGERRLGSGGSGAVLGRGREGTSQEQTLGACCSLTTFPTPHCS